MDIIFYQAASNIVKNLINVLIVEKLLIKTQLGALNVMLNFKDELLGLSEKN